MSAMRILLAVAAAFATIGAAPAPKCDRACLTGFAERYMDALAAKTPQKLPWAKTVAFSENSVPMMIGDGLWGSITARGARGTVVADTTTGNVAWFGRVDEHGQPGFYAMRLKVTDGRIAEVETVVRRQQGRPPFGDPTQFTYDTSYATRLPAAAQTPRERIVGLVEGYYNSVQGNDGTVLTRFDPSCARTENGTPATTGTADKAAFAQGCEAQFRLGLFRAIDRVRARRIAVIDEERGVAVAIGYSDFSARDQKLVAADGRSFAPPTKYPHSLGFMTLFKIRDGAILRVDEVANEVSYRMPSPFKE